MNDWLTEEEQRTKMVAFNLGLANLLEKFGVTISASDEFQGYAECGEDIQISINIGEVYIDVKYGGDVTPAKLRDIVRGE